MKLEENIFSTCKFEDKFKKLWHLVGNTPMLELRYHFKGKPSKIFVKAEHYNLTGSIKDRMALYIMYQAYKNNVIKPNDIIVEATSGNTGIYSPLLVRRLDTKFSS